VYNHRMKYIAFLRGIMPGNPNMTGASLRRFFEELGFKNVRTVIASGNVIFEDDPQNMKALEKKIETALPEKLGFSSTTIIRSEAQLWRLIKADPFKGKKDTPTTRLNVSFLKRGGEIFSVMSQATGRTPQIMARLEKEHGKQITMRTWKTIHRIIDKLRAVRY
jgi:uncharacterized protein (DUF1697 family)